MHVVHATGEQANSSEGWLVGVGAEVEAEVEATLASFCFSLAR